MKGIFSTICLVSLLLFSMTADADARWFKSVNKQDIAEARYELGLSMGAWIDAPGEVYVGFGDDYTTKYTSYLLKWYGGWYFHENFLLGGYFNFSPGIEYAGYASDNVSMMTEFGFLLAGKYAFTKRIALLAGLEIGYRVQTSDYTSTTGDGLGLNMTLNLQYLLFRNLIVYFNPGFLAQPVGGGVYDFSYAPIFYFNIGVSVVVF